MFRLYLSIALTTAISLFSFSNEADSIINLAKSEKNDSIRATLYLEAYAITKYNDVEASFKYIEEANKIAKANKFFVLEGMCMNDFGNYYEKTSDYELSLEYYRKALEVFKKYKYLKGIADAYANMGIVLEKTGKLDEAIDSYLKALEIDEKRNDSASIAGSYNNIALALRKSGDYNKSKEYLTKALEIKLKLGDKSSIATSYNNLGIAEIMMENIDESIKYFERALQYYTEANNLRGMADSRGNIGNVYRKIGNFVMAHKYLLESLKAREKLDEKFGMAKNLIMIADNLRDGGRLEEALDYAKRGSELSLQIKTPEIQQEAFRSLAEIYSNKGDYKNAFEFYKKMNELKDSLYQSDISRTIQEMETKYQTAKKEQEIDRLEKEQLRDKLDIAEQKEATRIEREQNEKQRFIIIGMLAILVVVSLFSVIIFRLFNHKKAANIQLNQQKEEILAQRDEIEAQRDLAARQRDLIYEQKQDITDSIEYAYKIQSAIFPDPEEMRLIMKDYFIFYRPRDIVSGDFYWVAKQNKKIIIIAADCTGHGVPGAFMSMLGVAYLNEIVNKENISEPDKILNRLRENIILALKQNHQTAQQKDGMDVAAITIDTENNTLCFAGANNPAYLIKNNELIEIKGDKMPVSIHRKMKPFTKHTFEIHTGDSIYIFSDGFPDQFGGPDGKKFKYKPFKELLEKNASLPMEQQKLILDNTFSEWIGFENNLGTDYDQIDDVLVIGIKI